MLQEKIPIFFLALYQSFCVGNGINISTVFLDYSRCSMDRTTNVYLIYSFRQEWTPPLYWAFGSITKPRSAGFSIHPAAAQSIYRVSSTLNSWAQRTTFDRMEKCSLLRGGLVDSWVPQSNTPEPPSFFSWSEHSGQFWMSWVFLERLQDFQLNGVQRILI